MRHPFLFLSLLLFGSTTVQSQEVVDTVSLRFDWPVGLTAHVEQEWFREKSIGTGVDSVLVASKHRMQVLAHPNGRLIRTDSMVIPQLEAARNDSNAFIQRMFSQLGVLTPSYVVNTQGEFVELADVARMKAAVDSLFAPVLEQLGSLPPQAKALFESILSEQTLTASAAQEWNAMVGTWVGADWEVGAVYEYDADEPSPVLPGLVLPMHYQFSAVERVPCTEDAEALECAELRMTSTPDPAAMREAVKKILGQMGATQDGGEVLSALESMEVETELTVVTNPATLLPYLVVQEKRVSVQVPTSATEAGGTSGQYERRIARYHYDK